jgi:hypothetical protein
MVFVLDPPSCASVLAGTKKALPLALLSAGHFESLFSPEPMRSLPVDSKALSTREKCPPPSVAAARVGSGERDHPIRKRPVLPGLPLSITLDGAVLSDNPRSPTFGDTKRPAHVFNTRSSLGLVLRSFPGSPT